MERENLQAVRRHAAYSRGTGGGPPAPPAPRKFLNDQNINDQTFHTFNDQNINDQTFHTFNDQNINDQTFNDQTFKDHTFKCVSPKLYIYEFLNFNQGFPAGAY